MTIDDVITIGWTTMVVIVALYYLIQILFPEKKGRK